MFDRWTTLYEFYDEAIGRANYRRDLKANPFTEVHHREYDDFKAGGLREKLYRQYLGNEVFSKRGTSWEDWIKKPLCEIEWELRILQDVVKEMAKIADNKPPDKGKGKATDEKTK